MKFYESIYVWSAIGLWFFLIVLQTINPPLITSILLASVILLIAGIGGYIDGEKDSQLAQEKSK